jgi:succinate-semialdehyde dehydrogenase/glutarate-semialdehyde dehydrogenase
MTHTHAIYPSTQLLIDGKWVNGAKGLSIPVVNPATEEIIGTVARATREDLDRALDAAGKAFCLWSETSAYDRSKILRRAAQLLRDRVELIAPIMTMEQGKPLAEAKMETLGAADMIEWFAEEGRRTYGRVVPSRGSNISQSVLKLPVGPVAAFTPWNFPINQAVRKISAALTTGCSIIVKAAEETPASPAELVRAFVDAGVPAGVINLVYGVPIEISEYLIPHPTIQKISFTGSTLVGKNLAALAGQHMKRATMELGGHAPALVFDDADLAKAVSVLSASKFRNGGQVCISPTRLLIQKNSFETFTERFIAATKAVTVGNGLDSGTQMGPLANDRRVATMDALVSDAVAKGAELKAGGRRIGNKGYFFEPTVLANVPQNADIMNNEPFGPVAIINSFDSLDDAITEANRLPYGLASYAFTTSSHTAHEISRRVQAGMTSINHHGLALPEVPFGGIQDSGYGSEGGMEAVEPYLITKFVSHMC